MSSTWWVCCASNSSSRAPASCSLTSSRPGPHNSGHLTFDACVTSQFEQQLRAVCGLPLGSAELLRPAAMANLLGDLWSNGAPDWGAVCGFDTAKLHLYGKLAPRPGRKMGHITALAATADEAEKIERDAPKSPACDQQSRDRQGRRKSDSLTCAASAPSNTKKSPPKAGL